MRLQCMLCKLGHKAWVDRVGTMEHGMGYESMEKVQSLDFFVLAGRIDK